MRQDVGQARRTPRLWEHPGQYTTVPRAAEMVGVSPRTIVRLINDGTLKATRPRYQWRVSVPSLNKLIHENAATVKTPTLPDDPLLD